MNIQNVKPRPMTPYYEIREELANYPHQVVNIDKLKYIEEERKIENEEAKNDLAMTFQRLLRGRGV